MRMSFSIPLVEIAEDKPAETAAVTVYPTRISLSSWRGCNLKCRYCVLQMDPVSANPFSAKRIATVTDLMAALDRAIVESPDISKLKITINDHTDPFLVPEIAEDTIAIVRALTEREVSVPIIITTKMKPSASVIERLTELKDRLNISIFVSVSDFSKERSVESIDVESRFEALKSFVEAGFHAALYLKPIGPWTDINSLTEYLHRYESYVSEVIISPLKGGLSDYHDIPVGYHDGYHFGGDIENSIIEAILSVNPSIRVSRKRSCAVNRRGALPCLPPLFGGGSDQGGDLFVNAVSTDGYCEVRPKSSLSGRPDLHLALSFIADLFAKLEVSWALIGSMRNAIDDSFDRMLAVNDIDVAVGKHDQDRIYRWLKKTGAKPKAYLGCKGNCSLKGRSMNVFPSVVDFDRYRSTIRVVVAGVFVDISSKDEAVVAGASERLVAGIWIPVAEREISGSRA